MFILGYVLIAAGVIVGVFTLIAFALFSTTAEKFSLQMLASVLLSVLSIYFGLRISSRKELVHGQDVQGSTSRSKPIMWTFLVLVLILLTAVYYGKSIYSGIR